MSTGSECFDAANCKANELYGRIRELEAEVERLRHRNNALKTHYEGCQRRENEYREREQHCRTKWSDAETKLAAIEGLARYEMTAPEYGLVEAYDSENGVCADKPDECDWIKASDVHAILRGEGEGGS